MEILANAQRMDTNVGSAADHWARFCKTKRSGRSGTPHRRRGRLTSNSRLSGYRRTRVDEVTDDLETLVFQTVSLDSINDDQKERTQAFVTLSLSIVKDKRPAALKAKVDPGAPGQHFAVEDLPANGSTRELPEAEHYNAGVVHGHTDSATRYLQPILHVQRRDESHRLFCH